MDSSVKNVDADKARKRSNMKTQQKFKISSKSNMSKEVLTVFMRFELSICCSHITCLYPRVDFAPCCCDIQSAHTSPYHVYPYPSPVRLQHAFQGNMQNNSPKMFHPKGIQKSYIDAKTYGTPNDSPILSRALCLTPRGSPIPGHITHLNEKFQDSLTLTSDTDALVAKISAMFPTVSETHIKILLKKYYNREAVVISALQVEKHPITTPGPLTMSPSVARLQKTAVGVYSALQLAKGVSGSTHGSVHFTPLSGTPHGSPLLRPASVASSYYGTNKSIDGQPGRTPHSPKMKLKYLKSIFSKAEETLILDVLANSDNNVQKASDELVSMGFSKKENVMQKPPRKIKEKEPLLTPKKMVTIMRTVEEKQTVKTNLEKKYKGIDERIVTLALESVDYNEDRAEQILNAVLQEEGTPKKTTSTPDRHITKSAPVSSMPGSGCAASGGLQERCSQSDRLPLVRASVRRVKNWTEQIKPMLKSSSTTDSKYKSQYSIRSSGPNPQLHKGPKDNILLEDYMAWNGPNPELRVGKMVKPEGPGSRDNHTGVARGPNPSIRKGPAGLSKGSLYQKLTKKSTVC